MNYIFNLFSPRSLHSKEVNKIEGRFGQVPSRRHPERNFAVNSEDCLFITKFLCG